MDMTYQPSPIAPSAARSSVERKSEAPLLLFVHLRKTAGTTTSYIMRRQFRRGEIVDLDARTVAAANEAWSAIAPERQARIKCIRGHLPFAPDLFAPRTITSFTIVRDPVERVISEYYFNLYTAGARFHAALARERITLDQFVTSELSTEVHNTQTLMLAGAKAGADSPELLQSAIDNIRDKMALVGVTERLDETLLLCQAILGWRHLTYRRINVNPWRPLTLAIPPDTRAAIEKANSLDRSLYKFACERMDELLRQHRISDSAAMHLRRASNFYSGIRRVIGFPRELWREVRMAAARRRVASNL